MVYIVPLALSTTGIIKKKNSWKLEPARSSPGLYVRIQKVLILNTFCTVQKFVPE
jgi:hypothetical protein